MVSVAGAVRHADLWFHRDQLGLSQARSGGRRHPFPPLTDRAPLGPFELNILPRVEAL
jgi:hypothetical protein